MAGMVSGCTAVPAGLPQCLLLASLPPAASRGHRFENKGVAASRSIYAAPCLERLVPAADLLIVEYTGGRVYCGLLV